MKRNIATTEHARRYLVVLGLILVVLTIASASFDLYGIDGQYRQLATKIGQSFFKAINAMREWNFNQGGIFVRIDRGAIPNPLLADPLREIRTTDGLKLAMVNHAQMARLLAELLTRQDDIHLHITSLTPIRPENKPDPWEERALALFEGGSGEATDIVAGATGETFRYMAPLKMGDSCLPCHNTPTEVGQRIRGGISIAFSYDLFAQAAASDRRRVLIAHGTFLALGLGLIVLTGRKLMDSIDSLQASMLTIKRLEGLLPICANCKKVRTAGADPGRQGSWVAIESYIEARTDAEFTHGLCPQCSRELYPGLLDNRTPEL